MDEPLTDPARTAPTVSICIPTYNGADWIADTIACALRQDFADIEVIVCDDASGDDTLAIARRTQDPRMRVLENSTRVGLARNWNRSVQASRGRYVKMLMQDDYLEPDCIRRLVEVASRDPGVGLVFSPRHVEYDDPDSPVSVDFRAKFTVLHTPLEPLAEVNDGRRLFNVMEADRFRRNFIGEPTEVLVTREAFERLGLFNVKTKQLTDLEMWLRIAYFYRVGFVDAPLATYRFHARSQSVDNLLSGDSWLDRLWMLEGLATETEIARELGTWRGRRVRLLTYANAAKRLAAVRPHARRRRLRELRAYLAYRFGRRQRLHERLATDRGAERGG